jgi:hypothetical protein
MTNVVYFGLPIENRTGRIVQMPLAQFNETSVTDKVGGTKGVSPTGAGRAAASAEGAGHEVATDRWIETSFPTFINERVTYGVSDCTKANENTRQIRRVWKIFNQTEKSFLVKVDSAFDL